MSLMSKGITFIGRQIAAARVLIGWEQRELAEAAGISAPTLRRMELSNGIPGGIKNNLLAIERALEQAGVVLVPAGKDGGAGVRLRAADTAAGLTSEIEAIEADMAKSAGPSARTPSGGMQRLERAHKRDAVTKLKNKRTRLAKAKK